MHLSKTLEKLGLSTEAINFQINSSFPKEMTALYQSVFDFIKAYEDEHGQVTTTGAAETKHNKIIKFLENNVFPKLKTLIEKHTGFKLSRMITAGAGTPDDILSVWMMLNEKNEHDFEAIIKTIYAAEGNDIGKIDFTDKRFVNTIDISRSLDKVKGTINRKHHLSVTICIPVGLFVIKDFIKKNPEKYQMTAEEITAVTLHEIGHIFSFVEYMGDLCFMGYFGNSIMRDITSSFEKDPIATIDNVVAATESNPSKNNKLKIVQDTCCAIVKRLRGKLIDNDGRYVSIDYNGVVFRIVQLMLFNLIMIITLISYTLLLQPLLLIQYTTENDKINKREYAAMKSSSMFERLADEYVSRYQMSKHLNDALIKLGYLIDNDTFVVFGPIYNEYLNRSLLLNMLIRIISIPTMVMRLLFGNIGEEHGETYEPDDVRLRRNISNLIDLLKDPKLPKEIKESLVADIDYMEEALKNKEYRYIFDFVSKVMGFIFTAPTKLLSLPLTHILGSANADKEFFRLFEHLDQMMSNKSFYYAAKIGSIVDKK